MNFSGALRQHQDSEGLFCCLLASSIVEKSQTMLVLNPLYVTHFLSVKNFCQCPEILRHVHLYGFLLFLLTWVLSVWKPKLFNLGTFSWIMYLLVSWMQCLLSMKTILVIFIASVLFFLQVAFYPACSFSINIYVHNYNQKKNYEWKSWNYKTKRIPHK